MTAGEPAQFLWDAITADERLEIAGRFGAALELVLQGDLADGLEALNLTLRPFGLAVSEMHSESAESEAVLRTDRLNLRSEPPVLRFHPLVPARA